MPGKLIPVVALVLVFECSPSRTILQYDETGTDGGTDGDGDGDQDGDGDGELDLGSDPAPDPDPCAVAYLIPRWTEILGPAYHDGSLFWGVWGHWSNHVQDDNNSWWQAETTLEQLSLLREGTGKLGDAMAVDDDNFYVVGLDRNPQLIPRDGGQIVSIESPPGYGESSGEMVLLADSLMWLNHGGDELVLVQTELETLDSVVRLAGPLGDQLAGSDEAGVFALRPVGATTELLHVDPHSGISSIWTTIEVGVEDVGELLAADDALYVIEASTGTDRIVRVDGDGTSATIVAAGTYEQLMHPVVFDGLLYFEFADPSFGWGRVDLHGGVVEELGPEQGWSPQRWQPVAASDECLFVLIRYDVDPDEAFPFEIVGHGG